MSEPTTEIIQMTDLDETLRYLRRWLELSKELDIAPSYVKLRGLVEKEKGEILNNTY